MNAKIAAAISLGASSLALIGSISIANAANAATTTTLTQGAQTAAAPVSAAGAGEGFDRMSEPVTIDPQVDASASDASGKTQALVLLLVLLARLALVMKLARRKMIKLKTILLLVTVKQIVQKAKTPYLIKILRLISLRPAKTALANQTPALAQAHKATLAKRKKIRDLKEALLLKIAARSLKHRLARCKRSLLQQTNLCLKQKTYMIQ